MNLPEQRLRFKVLDLRKDHPNSEPQIRPYKQNERALGDERDLLEALGAIPKDPFPEGKDAKPKE